MKRKAVVYIRFSPQPGNKNKLTVDMQRSACQDACSKNGLTITSEHVDTYCSGKNAERPGLAKALDEVCRDKGVLVTYSLSRLSRSTADAIKIADRLDKAGADLVSTKEEIDTTTAMGRFVYRLMASLAELQRQQVSESTAEALQVAQANGKRVTRYDRTPYGWLPKGKDGLAKDQKEQDAIRDIATWRKSGIAYKDICKRLIQNNHKPRGTKWYPMTVRRIYMSNAS